MTRKLTFVHAADLHLGAPFRGLRGLSPAWAELLVKAIPEAYGRIVEVACDRDVDFVIIAGDVYDEAQASFADYLCFFQGLERLRDHDIPVYLCTGNHDPLASWQRDLFSLPENAFMFAADRPDFTLYERDGEPLCVLGGRGFLNSVCPSDVSIAEGITRERADQVLGERAAQAPFGVGVLHTGLDFDPVKAPASRSELLAAGFDYWALGHIHNRFVDDEENPRISFSGCIQGRDIKETGRRGVNLVTLSEGERNRVEFVPTATIAWEKIEVDVESCDNIPAIVKAIRKSQFAANEQTQCERMVSRITLRGATALHDLLARPGVLEDVRNDVNASYADFFVDALVDKTAAPLDKSALRAEGLFPAALMDAADGMRADEGKTEAYLQEELVRRGVNVVDAATFSRLDELADEAENLVLDLLVQREKP